MKKPDFLVGDDVREELLSDPALDQSRIFLKTHGGVVTLTGTVPTYPEVLRASEDAWKVSGVTGVNNELLVGLEGTVIADAEVAEDARAALDRDRLVPRGAVDVDVVDGWLTLSGHVRNHAQRIAAKLAVGRVNGVLGITDDVAISADPIPSDIADRISKAIGRKAVLEDSAIEVSNTGHTVYLDGTTRSSAAKREAEQTAWDAPGVADVVDRITIIS